VTGSADPGRGPACRHEIALEKRGVLGGGPPAMIEAGIAYLEGDTRVARPFRGGL
jgi:hypothetical protein